MKKVKDKLEKLGLQSLRAEQGNKTGNGLKTVKAMQRLRQRGEARRADIVKSIGRCPDFGIHAAREDAKVKLGLLQASR
jgi:hypothetical protein